MRQNTAPATESTPPANDNFLAAADALLRLVVDDAADPLTEELSDKPTEFINDAEVWGTLTDEIINLPTVLSTAGGREAREWKTHPEARFGDLVQTVFSKHVVGKKDGNSIVTGSLGQTSKRRTKNNVLANYLMGLDVDSGASLEETFNKVRRAGLTAIFYTTHSHNTTVIEVAYDKFHRWAIKAGLSTEPTDELVRRYLREESNYVADVCDSAEFIEKRHEDGMKLIVRTRPIDKFRIIFPLAKPFIYAQQVGAHKDVINLWESKVLGMGRSLGIEIDRVARDPSRLFYLPRHPKGSDNYRIMLACGHLLRIEDVPAANVRERVSNDPFDRAAHALGGTSGKSGNGGLEKWARERADGFDIASLFRDHCEDRIRETQTIDKLTTDCPYDEDHSNPGDPEDKGTFIQSAGMDAERFAFYCSHNGCAGRDRLDMLRKAIESDWFPIDALWDDTYFDDPAGGAENQSDSAAPDKPSTHFKKMEPAIVALNKEIAIVQRGGDAVIYQKNSNGEGWLKLRAAKDIYAPWTAGKDRDSVFAAWLKSSARDHRHAVVFEPYRYGEPDHTPSDHLNMYRGFAIEPIGGDWMDLQRHIFRIICNGDKRLYAYFIAWLADMVQNPGRKIGTALAILSVEGTGKSLFADFVRQIWGNRHSVKVSDPRQLTGNFNGHMSGKMLAVAEEAFFAGDPKIDSIIKDMITSDRMMMENKFMDAIEVSDYRRFILLSNAENVVRATGDARRYAVTVASAEMKGNEAYFQKLAGQLKGGKVSAAMLHDLLRLDIATVQRTYGIDLRNPPLTDALISQILINMKAEDRWLRAVLVDGTFSDAEGYSLLSEDTCKTWLNESIKVSKENLYASYRSMVKARDGKEVSPEAISMFFIGAFRKQKGSDSLITVDGDGKTGRYFVLPSLPLLREFYAEKSKVPLDHKSVVDVVDLIVPPKKADGPDYDAALRAYEDAADSFINGVFDR
ncbi:hypothetical protein MPL1032_30125 [Mesorhizobium plurifarium]|uniref:NrS-1 polymerase-like helicase domain-containing protein n=1 Tax=Mesorhizobium plurifarium TaxID=69974 RepID=A0A0K2W2R2_MESPL|nr:hypothetical protein MPL1032_30125 [Mesorhizobium plurifarium]